jgi:thymidylate synthase
VTANGAYGYRWRHAQVPCNDAYAEHDQLSAIIDHLKAKPDRRRAVLQMWNVEDDLLKVDTSKDTCCNTSVMFSLRKGSNSASVDLPWETAKSVGDVYLDMTVTNRSNDLVWGLCGANMRAPWERG